MGKALQCPSAWLPPSQEKSGKSGQEGRKRSDKQGLYVQDTRPENRGADSWSEACLSSQPTGRKKGHFSVDVTVLVLIPAPVHLAPPSKPHRGHTHGHTLFTYPGHLKKGSGETEQHSGTEFIGHIVQIRKRRPGRGMAWCCAGARKKMPLPPCAHSPGQRAWCARPVEAEL